MNFVLGVFQQQQQVSIPYMKDAAHMAFVQQMGVAFLRIQHLNVDYDDAYTYISATLLDKTPPTGLFFCLLVSSVCLSD